MRQAHGTVRRKGHGQGVRRGEDEKENDRQRVYLHRAHPVRRAGGHDDPHPRLLLEGEGVHAGQGFTALFPDGWHDITLEVAWEPEGPGCWYISTPGFKGVCPIGLFVKV